MKIERESKLVKLSVESNLSPQDFAEAEIQFKDLDVAGKSALTIMRTLAGAVQGLEGAVGLFKLVLSDDSTSPKLICTLEFSTVAGKNLGLTVSPDTKISTVFNLSVRARKGLDRANITTVGELMERSRDDLIEIRNFGLTSVDEVERKLSEVGGKLKIKL